MCNARAYIPAQTKKRIKPKYPPRESDSEMLRFCVSAPFWKNGCNGVKCVHL